MDIGLVLLVLSLPFVQCSFNDGLSETLDSLIHGHSFASLFHGRPHTGALYNASLAGMKVSVVRLRSRTLWRNGANVTNVFIPPRTLPVPYVRRLLLVYHDLGNWSSVYNKNISGYDILTSVVGITLFDASSNSSRGSMRKLSLNPTEKPVLIRFNSSISAKCATFDADGRVEVSQMIQSNTCQTKSQGYFFLVTPSVKRRVWVFWVVGLVLGLFCLVFVVLIGTVLLRGLTTTTRTREMEREADEGEELHTFWINSSKMPRATLTRTHPVLETSGRP